MKNLLLSFMFLSALLLCPGCSNESELEFPFQSDADNSDLLTLSEALDIADSYFAILAPATRGVRRTLKSVEFLGSIPTRSNEKNFGSSYFILNYEDNKGFAIVSRQKEQNPVYALSDEGSLHISDTVYNKPLGAYLSGIVLPPTPIDTLTPWTPPVIEQIKTEISELLIDPKVRKWGQGSPFNSSCPLRLDSLTGKFTRTVTGCVPLALSIVMSYYEWPVSFGDNMTIDWPSVKQDFYNTTLAAFIYELGKPGNLNTEYGIKASSTYSSNVPLTFSNFKYTTPVWRSSGNVIPISTLKNESVEKRPVLLRGYNDEGGHEWVVDGYISVSVPPSISSTGEWVTTTYLHCIWGWNGYGNGYFRSHNNKGGLGGYRHSKDPSDEPRYPWWDTDSVSWYTNLSYINNYNPNY